MSYSVNNRYIDGDEMDDIAPLLSSDKRSDRDNDPYFKVKRYHFLARYLCMPFVRCAESLGF